MVHTFAYVFHTWFGQNPSVYTIRYIRAYVLAYGRER
jgi:hypothetical protein